ncbi:MAG: DUF4139 domain-containing protein [Rhodospirillales bacterium]|nr:DUF4139 domain-containing protein [Rhodospirillales bacterium]
MGRISFFAAIFLGATGFGFAHAGEVEIPAKDRTDLAITLYSNGFAMIDETRSHSVTKGLNTFALTGIANQISTDTVRMDAGDLQILEFGYDKTVLSAASLLDRYKGQEVFVEYRHELSGVSDRKKAKILTTRNGTVLEINGEIYPSSPGHFVYPKLPDDLRAEPALTLMAQAKADGPSKLQLSYLARGFSWRANYVAVLNEGETALELTGRATLTNSGGMDLENAAMTLIAGNVTAPQTERRNFQREAPMAMMAKSSDAMVESAPHRSFSNRHLYTLPGKRTLRSGESKQATLFSTPKVAVERRFIFAGGIIGRYQQGERQEKAAIQIRFKNTKKDGLGIPLPGGAVNTYKKDQGGTLRYVGQNSLSDIAVDKTGQISIGKAFDITLKRTQTEFKRTGPKNRNFESAWKLEIANAKTEAITVVLEERMHGDWKIIQSSQEAESKTSQKAVWQIKVPAKGTAALTYQVAVTNR